MPLGPVVTSSWLTKHKVVRSEDLAIGSRSDTVHGARLQVHQDSSGHILATTGLVVVDIDPLQLQVRLTSVGTSGVNTMLVWDDLPELKQEVYETLNNSTAINRVLMHGNFYHNDKVTHRQS